MLSVSEISRGVSQVIDFLPDATFAIDEAGRVIFWNQAMEELTGITSGEMLDGADYAYALPFYNKRRPMLVDLVLNPHVSMVADNYTAFTRCGDTIYAEGMALPADRLLWGKAGPIRDESGQVVGAIESLRDITNMKRLQRTHQDALTALEQLANFLPDPTFAVDREGRIILWNKAIERISGKDSQNMLGKANHEYSIPLYGYRRRAMVDYILHPELLVQGDHPYEHCDDGSLVFEGEIHSQLTGRKRWIISHASPIHDSMGTKVGAIQTLMDITERRQIEQALQASEERYHTLFENATEGIFRTTPEGRFLSVNPSLARMGGYASPGEMIASVHDIGQELYENPQDRCAMMEMLTEHDMAEGFEFSLLRVDKSRIWISMNIHTVRDEQGNPLYYEGTCVDITERKQAEERLRESEHHLKQFIDFLPDPTLAIGLDGEVLIWNRAMEDMTGVKASDIIGQTDYAYALPFYGRETPILVDLCLKPDKEAAKQYTIIHREENLLIAEAEVMGRMFLWGKASRIFNSRGELIGAIETIRDITDRKRVEQALKESEEKFRLLFEASADGNLILEDGRCIDCNAAALSISGCPDKSLLVGVRPENLSPAIQPDGRPSGEKARAMADAALRTGFHRFEWLLRRFDGTLTHIDIMLTAMIVQDKKLLFSSWRDISHRKRAEERLRASEERYRLVAENIHDIISLYDLDFNYTYVSPSVVRIAGYQPREMLGKPVMALIDEASQKKMQDILSQIRELVDAHDPSLPSRSWTVELKRIIKGGVMWTESKISLFLDDQGQPLGILSVTRNIDERKRSEEQMLFFQEQLQHSQKLEAIGTLAGGIAHDFNNILSVIVGFSELVRDNHPADRRTHEMIGTVLKASERAKDLVNQILTFSRQVKVEMKPLNAHLIVKEVVKLLRSMIPSTIDIIQNIDPYSGAILADPTQLHQVVMNLCTNAYQAMQDTGGTLSVDLQAVTLDDDITCKHPELHAGDYVRLGVKDTGCGMEEATMQRCFEPFFTTKEKGMGTGLGLAIIHGIVKDIGGAIILSSTPGIGSTFEVFFPRFGIDVSEDLSAEEDIPMGNGQCILLVDDEPDIVAYGTVMLQQIGYTVQGYSSSHDALEAFRHDPQIVDLVITDQTMPGLRGDQLAEAMLTIRPSLPIVIMTGYSTLIDHKGALCLGIKELINKPFSRMAMARVIQKALSVTGGL